MTSMASLKEKFLQIYANLPLGVRKELIAVVDDEPISWNAAYLEIHKNTSRAKEILKKIHEIGLI